MATDKRYETSMKKVSYILLSIFSISLALSACSKEPTEALELADSYYNNGYAVLVFYNNSSETITSVNGRVILWSSSDVELGAANFYWNSSCEPGGMIEVKLAVDAVGHVDRNGYFISSINNGDIDKYL